MDIAAWLHDLGLEAYAAAFRENKVDAAVLPKLTSEDLREIGVIPVGDRRRLLDAIAALGGGADATQPADPAAVAPAAAKFPEAERRQLTVLFCDLVGSTALSARLDPEDMRDVIRGYQDCCAGVIARFEGFVAKFMGDGVLAYFGYPRAHEDEAERAVRAGLALTEATARLITPAGEALSARVGIATGLVVVGDLIGEGAAQEQAVVGDTPNLAARLQGLAAPGQVVIAASTRRLLGAGFELQSLGKHDLKGLATPVEAFAVAGERATPSRFEARSSALLPMVGRDQELALLLERWAQAKAGEGQGVLLVGDAGIGKSRISRALLDALAEEPHFRVRYQCSPYHTDSALWPVIQQLSHAAGLEADDPVESRLDKLEALLDRADGREAAPLIADLLGLDGAARYGPLDMTPQMQRVRTLHALAEQLLGLAAQQPVLVVLEDAHWIDPTTLELIEQSLERIAAARVLILLTSRPDQQPALAAHPHVTRLTLNRLGRAGVEAIVARLGGGRLPSATIDAIIARTDGVPLFVEELTKAILETGETTIPASLHDSLMARLDRIPEVKEVAQIAACIGREFDFALLAAVADRAGPNLLAALDRLASAELIFRRGTPPDARYTFKHALIQDTAYQSLLKSKRQQLHARIAQVLAQHFPDTAAEVLAYHLTAGGLNEQAAKTWYLASQNAGDRSAYREAVMHLQRGLEAVKQGGDEPWCIRQEIELQNALGTALVAARGFVPEVAEAYDRARKLCAEVDEPAQLHQAIYGIWMFNMRQADLDVANQLSRDLLAAAEDEERSDLVLQANHAMWTTAWHRGELDTAWRHAQTGLRLYRSDEHHDLARVYGGHDAGACCRYTSAVVSWLRGSPDKAVAWSHDGLKFARDLNHPFTETLALEYITLVYAFRREYTFAEEQLGNLMRLSAEHRFPIRTVLQPLHEASILLARGDAEHAIVQAQSGLAAAGVIGVKLRRPYFLALLADAYLKTGRHDQGLETIDEALDIVEQSGERWWQAELHRLQGQLRLALRARDQADAEECFRCALAASREQAARSLELRAATSLARLWAEQGRRAEAHDLLAPVYGWFTEGFDTLDLIEAKALLDELA